MMISVSDREKYIVGKGENPDNQHFLISQECLKKPVFCRAVKTTLYLGKG